MKNPRDGWHVGMQDFPNARSAIQLLCRSEQITRLFQFSLLSKDEKRTSFRSPKGIDEAKLSLIWRER